jgi:hypothetical protein
MIAASRGPSPFGSFAIGCGVVPTFAVRSVPARTSETTAHATATNPAVANPWIFFPSLTMNSDARSGASAVPRCWTAVLRLTNAPR